MSDPKTVLNNSRLSTDMDAQGFKILNLPADQPLPPAVIGNDTITDAMVKSDAGILQSKLNLNGAIPPTWLGNSDTTAAEGDLAEYLSNKNQPDGYAGLDSGGLLSSTLFPALTGTGTVTSVAVTVADGIAVTGSPITTNGTLAFTLTDINPVSVAVDGTGGNGFITFATQSSNPTLATLKLWSDSGAKFSFGNNTSTNGFAVKFTGEFLSATRIFDWPDKSDTIACLSDVPSVMVGVGGSHHTGLVPDPGPTGATTDYLARDGTWKEAVGDISYQPDVPTPTISPSTNTSGSRTITLGDSLAGVSIFYQVGGGGTGPFTPYVGGTVTLAVSTAIYAYAAKVGYNNSAAATYTNPNS